MDKSSTIIGNDVWFVCKGETIQCEPSNTIYILQVITGMLVTI